MKKIMLVLACVMLIAIVSGCSSTMDNSSFSMNYQKSLVRSAGDLSATTILETYENIDVLKVIQVADIIIKYLEGTDIETLQRDELIIQISEKIPYDNLKKIAFSLVNKLPETIEMKDAKILLISYCKGMKIGAQEFSILDRKK